MTKVLLVSGSWPPLHCGVGIYTKRYYSYISKIPDYDFVLLTSAECAPDSLSTIPTPAWRLRNLSFILRNIKKIKPAIVHIQYPTQPYKRQIGINILPFFLRLRGYRTITTLHEYYQTSLLGKIRSIITVLPAKRIIVSNQADAMSLPVFLRRKVTIIPIGSNIQPQPVNTARFEKILSEANLSKNKKTVVFFGFPFQKKRLEVLIQAVTMFADNLQLLLIFDHTSTDPYVKHILDLVKSSVANGAAIGLAGYLNDQDVSVALSGSEYFVLAQDQPPLTAKSGTAIAASIHGCVVVAAQPDRPSFCEPFVSGENCLLLEEINPTTLARALNQLAENPDQTRILAKNAQKLAHYFDWDEIAKKFDEIYREIV
jgi:glycosyltransferase involved in cell wall biosynthesis